jgi:plastocyanin
MHRMSMTLGLLVVSWAIGISHADAERIKILDRCDPATFNTTPAGVLCDPHFDGGVTLDEFGELLSPTAFGHPAWRFNAPYVEIEPQEKVRVINRGGEDHTFTEVSEQFGGGRVPNLNMPLGLTPLPQCGANVAPPIHPGDSIQIRGLSSGTHYFMCCIHPWMHAIIDVRPEANHDHHPGDE